MTSHILFPLGPTMGQYCNLAMDKFITQAIFQLDCGLPLEIPETMDGVDNTTRPVTDPD